MGQVGRYELLDLLGKGGVGEVWRARDTELGRVVALKLLQRTSVEDLARFKREAHVTATLNHPNIAQLFEFGENYIAMQLVEGEPIAKPEHLAQAARAVQAAHEKGILHRDLKPANILVSVDRAFVLDFGLAREVKGDQTAMSLTGDILGTPSYMAPEQARGQVNALDARTDVYGLGATLYALLMGRPPHTGPSAYDVITKVINEDPAPPPGELGVIAMKAIDKDPARRYATAAEFADDLDCHFRDEPIRARPASPAYRLRKQIARRPAVWGLSVVLVLAVLAGVTTTIVQLARVAAAERARADSERAAAERLRLSGLMERAQRVYGELDDEMARTMSDERLSEVRATLEVLVAELGDELGKHDEDAALHFLMGEALTLLAREEAAIEHYGCALDSPEGDRGREMEAYARSALARAFANLGRVQDLMLADSPAELDANSRTSQRLMPVIEADLERAMQVTRVPERTRLLLQLWDALEGGDPESVLQGTAEEIARGGRCEAFHMIRGHTQTGRRAMVEFSKAIDLDRGLWRAWLHRGLERFAGEDFRGATADFSEAIRLHPTCAAAYSGRGSAHFHLVEMGAALADFDMVVRLEPGSAVARVNRGLVLREYGDLGGAIDEFSEALHLDPQSAFAYHCRGIAYWRQGDFASALQDCQEAIRFAPDLWDAYVSRGAILVELGRPRQAIQDFDIAIRGDGHDATSYFNRGNAWLDLNELPRAIGDYGKAIHFDWRYANAFHNRGLARNRLGDLGGSMGDFDKALRLIPEDARCRRSRAIARAEAGDWMGTAEDCREALRVAPSDWSYRAPVERMLRDVERRLRDSSPDYR